MSTFGQTSKPSTTAFRSSLLFAIAAVVGFANQSFAQCAFFDDFQRAESNALGNGWVEVENIEPEIKLASNGGFGYVDVSGSGLGGTVSLTQSNIDTSSLAVPGVAFVWLGRNATAEAGDVMQVDWRLSGGAWQPLGEFDLTNTVQNFEDLPLPAAALNTNIDIRFVVVVDQFQEGVLLDNIGVCESTGPPDCNSNGLDDGEEVFAGTADDNNNNGIPDECDECVEGFVGCSDGLFCNGAEQCMIDVCINQPAPCGAGESCDELNDQCLPDCNNNGVDDAVDISGGTSDDLNANNIPDECDECVFDADCDDGSFCTGTETCNVDTCAAGSDPCLAGQSCEDVTDTCPPTGVDCNTNGIGDATDIAGATSDDVNTNGVPDECDECTGDGDCDDGLFCNGDETCELGTCVPGTNPCTGGETCDELGDVCIINADCNSNGVDDATDIAGATSEDTNANSVPDECDECLVDGQCDDGNYCNGAETCDVDRCVAGALPCVVGQSCDEPTDSCLPIGDDCNTNGIGDAADIAGGFSDDLNANNVPDECDECVVDGDCDDGLFCNGAETCNGDACAAGTDPCLPGEVCNEGADTCDQPDCNTNGIGDLDDIAGGTSADADSNGVPDECGCTSNAECDDGLFCNGVEICNAGACEPGGNPCLPGQTCTETALCQSGGGGGGGGGGAPADGDNDGVPDGTDACADTPTGADVDEDGCAESQLDDDEDGVFNDVDVCVDTPAGETTNAAGCSASQLDSDGDGVTNDVDLCPGTVANDPVDDDGCSDAQLDDGTVDPDPQPGPDDDVDTNGETPDDGGGDGGDGDGGGDGGDDGTVDDPDSDGDGVPDSIDECALTPAGFEVNSVGCALISPDPDDGETEGCANGVGCGAGGAATLMLMMLGFGGLKYNRRRVHVSP